MVIILQNHSHEIHLQCMSTAIGQLRKLTFEDREIRYSTKLIMYWAALISRFQIPTLYSKILVALGRYHRCYKIHNSLEG